MNRREQEEAIDILIAGNALLDMRALVRNVPREHSLRAMLEFLEGTAEYIAKVEALIRALEPTLGTSPARVRLERAAVLFCSREPPPRRTANASQNGVSKSDPTPPRKADPEPPGPQPNACETASMAETPDNVIPFPGATPQTRR